MKKGKLPWTDGINEEVSLEGRGKFCKGGKGWKEFRNEIRIEEGRV